MPNLRTATLEIADQLAVGDPVRRKLLAAVQKDARVDGKVFKPGSYFNMFFNEKGLSSKTYDITDSHGVKHSIPSEVVLEALAQTRGSEKAGAEKILRQIDFRNGDVHHFLEHLARGLAEQYDGVLR